MAKIMNLVDTKALERMQAINTKTPFQKMLYTLDSEMQSVLQQSGMSTDEKVRAYNQVLQKYLQYHKADDRMRDASQVDIDEMSPDIEREVMKTVPTRMKKKAEVLLERIKDNPNTSWNSRGEFVYKGRVSPGSNIVDLINDTLRQRKIFKPQGRFDFARALRHENVPLEMVGNNAMWRWMHRPSATSDAFSSDVEDSDLSPARTKSSKRKRNASRKGNWEKNA